MRRAAIAAVLLAAAVAPAAAQEPTPAEPEPALTFAHDRSLDGTSNEIRSGFYPGDPPAGDPLAARFEDTYETFPLEVPEGTTHSSLTAQITWPRAQVNLDLAVYRLDAQGQAINPAVTRSAAPRGSSETATYAPGHAVEPGRYLVVVDNYCSRDADDDPRSSNPSDTADCGIGQGVQNEDDFSGTVTLGNQLPTVTLAGPDSVRAKETASFTATARDADGTLSAYLFDLDGDGTYELDSDGMAEVSTTYPTRGQRTISVQVLDDAGAAAYASKTINVTRPLSKASTLKPLTKFRLSRRSFGGRAQRRLVILYRLRERARVDVALQRRGKRVRLIGRGVRRARHDYRIILKPAHLRRGLYTVRISVLAASGKRQTAELRSRRR